MADRQTRAWTLYERGVSYNNRLTPNQYTTTEVNTEFFVGNQWINLPDTPAMRRIPKPTFNILKRVASLFIASLTSSGVTIRTEALARYAARPMLDAAAMSAAGEDGEDAADYANAALSNLLEKLKFDYRVRDALFDGAVTGDYCAHFWFDPDAEPYGGAFEDTGTSGEIKMELVDGINVMFGNPNVRSVEDQPYILLVGRDTLANLRQEAEARRKGGRGEADALMEDTETEYILGVGGKTELEGVAGDGDEADHDGKALYVLLYERDTKTGTIHATKATKTAVIYEDVDTGMNRYPVAWGTWERQKNQYHGRALVTGLIPNQIFINTLFATVMRHLQTSAFPKVLYNGDYIPIWDDTPGSAIRVTGLRQGEPIPQLVTAIQPVEMSSQISQFLDKAIQYTKDCLGATDAQMGNVKPENTSALMVLQTNAEVPLENIRAGLYEWTEDIGAILLDMMGTYYGVRPVVVEREFTDILTGPGGEPQLDPVTGLLATTTVRRKVLDAYDFSAFKRLWLNLRVDVGATTYFSEIAMTQTLDNLRQDGVLSVIQYLERLPDKLIPQKEELIRELKEQVPGAGDPSLAGGAAAAGPALPAQGGELSPELQASALPTRTQQQITSMPGVAKRAALSVANAGMTK